MNVLPCRLYLITPPRIEPEAFSRHLAAALDAGDVACVQLRLKEADDDAIRRAADILRPLTQDRNVAFILNDRPDLAAELGCDGVHIGQDDLPYAEARRIMGPEPIIGVTCHASKHLAVVAADSGADYVSFGAFFPTRTKKAKSKADPETLSWWRDIATVQSVAIGGVAPGNCAPLVDAGADFLAAASAVWEHPDGPAAGVGDFNEAIGKALGVATRPAT